MTAAPATTVTAAMVRASIDEAKRKNYTQGVLGFRAGVHGVEAQTFTYGGQAVTLMPCVSALAARAALLERPAEGWLVLVTDRSDDDLGAGLLAHLVGQRLRSPDVWQAVGQQFAATGIDAHLTSGPGHREIAAGLLEATSSQGWPPAPAGLLTRDHAYGAVARRWLDLPEGPLDLLGVLEWSSRRTPTTRIGDLRREAGDALTNAVLRWIATSTGPAEPVVAKLVEGGAVSDLLPLGLVLDPLLTAGSQDGELVMARLQHRWGTAPRGAVTALAASATAVAADLIADAGRRDDLARVLARADELAREGQGESLMVRSVVLRSGLVQRLHRLADELQHENPALPTAVESAWASVAEHLLHGHEGSVPALLAAVRLVRWLDSVTDEPVAHGLAALARRQADVDAWVDSAVNDATSGVDDDRVAAALEDVLRRVRVVRDEHDRQFAQALAVAGGALPTGQEDSGAPVWLLENVLTDVVARVARMQPTLLLVLDGLSTGVATEVVADIDSRTDVAMSEALLPDVRRRGAALAVLPSITDASRASLLTGTLATGQQQTEQTGYQRLMTGLGITATPLFHKAVLDTSRPGFAVSDPVRAAIADTGKALVTCVLNTIDDALDRSDPGGTDWTADTVKHLVPLLQRAREAGRVVIITSDHGHVVERRAGVQRSYPGGANTRYRGVFGEVCDDEVLVAGPRVLTADNRAVLAVSERLRYGPLKAGYHGGAAPAEVVVPVILLVPAGMEDNPWRPAPYPAPPWWEGSTMPVQVSVAAVPVVAQPDLFTETEPKPTASGGLGASLVATAVYAQQRRLAGRVSVTDAMMASLIDALAGAPNRRLTAGQAAMALGLQASRAQLALGQVAKLINVEGYPVVSTDPATGAVVLDPQVLAEQYGLAQLSTPKRNQT